jgi:hypothetical protein
MNEFLTQAFDKQLCPQLYEGSQSLANVAAMCEAALEQLSEVDPFDLCKAQAVFLADLKVTFQGLRSVCRLPFSSEEAEAVTELVGERESERARGSGPVARVRAALRSAAWYADRGRRYLDSLPTVLEKESDFRRHQGMLTQLQQPGTKWGDITFCAPLITALDDYSMISLKADPGSIGAFGADLLEAALQQARAMLASAEKEHVDEAGWNFLGQLLQSVTIGFPLNRDAPALQVKAAEIKGTAGAKLIIDRFMLTLSECQDSDFSTTSLKEVQKAASSAAGLALPASAAERVSDVLCEIVGRLAKAYFQNSVDGCPQKAFEELVRFVPDAAKASWAEVQTVATKAAALRGPDTPYLLHPERYDLKAIRKALADAKAITKDPPPMQHLGGTLRDTVVSSLHELVERHAAANDELLQAALVRSEASLKQHMQYAASLVYSDGHAARWLHGAADLKGVLAAAAAQGFQALTVESLLEARAALVERRAAWQAAVSDQGIAADDGTSTQCDTLLAMLQTTAAEVELVSLAASRGDPEDARARVQGCIRRLRGGGCARRTHCPPPVPLGLRRPHSALKAFS